jgi:hypothetical protein
VGVNESEPSESRFARADSSEIRKQYATGIADGHHVDSAGTLDEHTHLSSGLERDLGEVSGELWRDNRRCRDAPSGEALQELFLSRFEAGEISEDVQ